MSIYRAAAKGPEPAAVASTRPPPRRRLRERLRDWLSDRVYYINEWASIKAPGEFMTLMFLLGAVLVTVVCLLKEHYWPCR